MSRMFRGLTEHVWVERLVAAGWPHGGAEALAAFLVGRVEEVPALASIMAGPVINLPADIEFDPSPSSRHVVAHQAHQHTMVTVEELVQRGLAKAALEDGTELTAEQVAELPSGTPLVLKSVTLGPDWTHVEVKA
jgi:hypothetical protein